MVRFYKTYKIDLNGDYPCPCKRKGRLKSIILTEAMGCDLCQQIFVVSEDGQTIEQLSSLYPQKRLWRWNGRYWISNNTRLSRYYFLLALAIVVILAIILCWLSLHSASGIGIILWGILALLLAVIPAFIVWLVYRR